jgi:hypothetical protein
MRNRNQMTTKVYEQRKAVKKKTTIGQGKHTKFKKLNSSNMAPKGYKKRYRGQGRR